MGVSYRSHAIIGIRVPKQAVMSREKVKAFEHDHPADWKIDPISGRPLWREGLVIKPGFEGDEDKVTFAGRYKVMRADPDSNFYFIALQAVTNHEDGSGGCTREPFDLHKTTKGLIDFQGALERYGLWDPTTFGLWAVLYIS